MPPWAWVWTPHICFDAFPFISCRLVVLSSLFMPASSFSTLIRVTEPISCNVIQRAGTSFSLSDIYQENFVLRQVSSCFRHSPEPCLILPSLVCFVSPLAFSAVLVKAFSFSFSPALQQPSPYSSDSFNAPPPTSSFNGSFSPRTFWLWRIGRFAPSNILFFWIPWTFGTLHHSSPPTYCCSPGCWCQSSFQKASLIVHSESSVFCSFSSSLWLHICYLWWPWLLSAACS